MRHAQRWSWSTGERGRNRVRVFEHHTTGLLFLEVYEFAGPSKKPRPKRIALGHRDREAAKEKAEALASAIRRAPRDGEADVTVRTLFDIYVRERTPQKRSRGSQLHDRLVADLFVRSVGPHRLAKTLNRRDWDRYMLDRASGTLHPDGREPGEPVGNRQVQYDLLTIQAVMNWATTYQETPGRPLLDRNPLKGLEAPHEESPARPLVTASEYSKLLAVAGAIHPLFELALVVAHETGHRMGAIRLLRWSDINLSTKHIRWRAENDKIGFEHTVPVSDTTVAALQAARNRQGAIGDAWVFPAVRKPSEPMSRHTLLHWWQRAVTEAKLAPATRRGFHALRRKFATDLRHDLPLKDQAFLGGWKTVRTLADVYQQADDTTMRNALARRRGTEAPAVAIESTPRIHTMRGGT